MCFAVQSNKREGQETEGENEGKTKKKRRIDAGKGRMMVGDA